MVTKVMWRNGNDFSDRRQGYRQCFFLSLSFPLFLVLMFQSGLFYERKKKTFKSYFPEAGESMDRILCLPNLFLINEAMYSRVGRNSPWSFQRGN